MPEEASEAPTGTLTATPIQQEVNNTQAVKNTPEGAGKQPTAGDGTNKGKKGDVRTADAASILMALNVTPENKAGAVDIKASENNQATDIKAMVQAIGKNEEKKIEGTNVSSSAGTQNAAVSVPIPVSIPVPAPPEAGGSGNVSQGIKIANGVVPMDVSAVTADASAQKKRKEPPAMVPIPAGIQVFKNGIPIDTKKGWPQQMVQGLQGVPQAAAAVGGARPFNPLQPFINAKIIPKMSAISAAVGAPASGTLPAQSADGKVPEISTGGASHGTYMFLPVEAIVINPPAPKKQKRTGPTKVHRCEECGKTFGTSALVNRHKMIHSGLRPFPCKMCDKKFRQRVHLKKHMRLHTGERPFTCSYCKLHFFCV